MDEGPEVAMPRGHVVVGVSGSIAAYKAAEVTRGLLKADVEVRVVMTPSATRFVGPATFAALTGSPVHTEVFHEPERVHHVELGRWADAFLACGATASTLARLVSGSAEDMLSATYLMCRCPIVVAPAMHTEMWEHAATQRNLERLRADGATIVGPDVGDLASGDHGVGRLADPSSIVETVIAAMQPKDLSGLRVLLTVGPTREALDPVRFISNRSTGRMGFALAQHAHRRGADVTVVAGPTSAPAPDGVRVVRVETAEEMLAECLDRFDDVDVAVLNAAVADWRPASVSSTKVKKKDAALRIDLEATPDIAAELGRKKGTQLLVLFAAETDRVTEYARDKLLAKHADLVVANLVGQPGTGFDSETNHAALVTTEGAEQLERLPKDVLAGRIWDTIATMSERTRPR